MKICIGSAFPGGPEAEIVYPFEDSELLDYYTIGENGRFEQTAQTRRCLCSDLIESVIRRGIDAVIVKDLTSTSLFKFASSRVRVLVSPSRSVKASIDLFQKGELPELTMRDVARLAKKRKEGV